MGEVNLERVERWISRNIPSEYSYIHPEKLPNIKAYEEVLAYQKDYDAWLENKNRHGIVAFGRTGMGKTKSIYQLIINSLKVDFFGIKDIEFISAPGLASKVRTLATSNVKQLECDLEKFSWSEFFFIDDLHQAKFTPRYSEELFRIIENRYSQNLPTFITCQVPGDALVSKLTADNPQLREIAEAIVRRIRDMCEPIDFDAK